MSKVITIAKAMAMPGQAEVEPVTIEIGGEPLIKDDEPVRNVPEWSAQHVRFYNEQAAKLEQALYESLPGGTYERLLALMLNRQSGILAVSLFAIEKRQES